MSTNLQAWVADLEARIKALEGQGAQTAASLIGAQWGSLSTAEPGWILIRFSKPFPSTPGVVAVHGSNIATPGTQSLSPPKISPPPSLVFPSLSTPSLASLQVVVPPAPESWGQRVRQAIDSAAGSTIGGIPVIGGYLVSGVDGTFGALGEAAANVVQGVYYAFDAPALLRAMAQSAENKAATDWNNGIAGIQGELDKSFNSIANSLGGFGNNVNAALESLTTVAQGAVNDFYAILNTAIGLVDGEAIPVAKVQGVSALGFQVYCPGNDVQVSWLAVGQSSSS